MNPILHIKSISDINRFVQSKTKHPLVSVVDFSKVYEFIEPGTRISADFYSVMFKNYCTNHFKYGRQSLDFQDGSLICIAPQQILEMDSEIERKEDMIGWGLFFHPDLIRGTPLYTKIRDYSFFSYQITEALHLSDKETQTLFDCIQKIETELKENMDTHSQNLIVSNIELFLNYCSRYYDRQFITRKSSNSKTLIRFEQHLKSYFHTSAHGEKSLPTVRYLADLLHLSPGYLSDLLKKETGMNAQEHIHFQLIEEAKSILLNSDQPVGDVAFALGFEYPQYFSRLFKQKTGKTPREFRKTGP